MANRERSTLLPAERMVRILDLLAQQGIVTLAELMAATSSSVATVRRDLVLLEQQGLLSRTRGGAKVVLQQESRDEEFGRRQSRDRRGKRMVAEAAAERLEGGETVFLNDGTTIYALAQMLLSSFRGTVITSGLNIAQLLARSSEIETIVIGGSLGMISFGTTGPLARQAVSQLHADVAILACDGITAAEGVRSDQLEDAEVARAMAAHADRTIVLASESKIENLAQGRIFDWSSVDELITTDVTEGLRAKLSEEDVALTVVS